MEIKRSSNYILSRLVETLNNTKGSIKIGYKHGDLGLMIESKKADMQMLTMFALGVTMETMDMVKEDEKDEEIFFMALKEGVEELHRRVCNRLEDINNEENR